MRFISEKGREEGLMSRMLNIRWAKKDKQEKCMKIVVFWVVVPCSLVEVYQIAPMMEAASTSEMSVHFYQNT
jgi:hypothetical protein